MIMACCLLSLRGRSNYTELVPPRHSARGRSPPEARCCLPHPPHAAPSLGSASLFHPPPVTNSSLSHTFIQTLYATKRIVDYISSIVSHSTTTCTSPLSVNNLQSGVCRPLIDPNPRFFLPNSNWKYRRRGIYS